MIPNKKYVETKFDEFNKLCFNGSLPSIPILMSDARTFLGAVKHRKRRTLLGKWEYFDFSLSISRKIDRPQEIIDDTILHEMIHYFILYNQIQDKSAHGPVFRKMMNEINIKYNRNITISHKSSEDELKSDKEKRAHLICAIEMTDGKTGIIITAKTRLFQLWDMVSEHPSILSWNWYLSHNPYFNRFRKSLKLKFYIISKNDIELQLKDALPLQREGNKIKIRRP